MHRQRAGGRPLTREPAEVIGGGGVEVVSSARDVAGGTEIRWAVRNPGRSAVSLDRVGVRFDVRPARVLEHGWQSWSVVRRCAPDDVRPARRRHPRWRRAMYSADAERAGWVVAGDQFLLDDGGVCGFVTARSHFGTVEASPDGVTAWALLDGVELAPGAERELDTIWAASGDPGELYSVFADRWGDASGARRDVTAPTGWCSWYQYFNAVTPAHVRAATALARGRDLEVIQIDDGYQSAIGDWRLPKSEWAEGTAAVAADIRAAGLRAGIWTAPFVALAGSRVASEHPDWFVRDRSNRAVGAMRHRHLWGGWALALDTTNPAVCAHLAETFAALRGEGFDYHKLDFLYAAALAGRRHDPTATRAESLRRGLDAVRDALGDDTFVVGCGCPLGPAVGVVDAMRVSPDVAPWWGPPVTMAGFDEAIPAALNAIRASVLRAPLHRRLWVNDPDCLVLRPTDTALSPEQRALLAAVVAASGGLVVVSDDLARYGDDEWTALARVRDQAAATSSVDLVDPFASAPDLRTATGTVHVDWRTSQP